LSWSHYRALLAVNELEEREKLARTALQKKWPREVLRREIKKRKAAKQLTLAPVPEGDPLTPIKGKLDIYRIVAAKAGPWQAKPVIDLGFSNYFRPSGNFPFHEGDIVSSSPSLRVLKEAAEADLFTYRAWVLEVTDGDTLWVLIDLGFGFTTKQQLRLRGLDAPEITSRDGLETKRFVERELRSSLRGSVPVIITGTKSDKYDRYLTDVFYQTKSGEQYLNNQLLQNHLAQKVY